MMHKPAAPRAGGSSDSKQTVHVQLRDKFVQTYISRSIFTLRRVTVADKSSLQSTLSTSYASLKAYRATAKQCFTQWT